MLLSCKKAVIECADNHTHHVYIEDSGITRPIRASRSKVIVGFFIAGPYISSLRGQLDEVDNRAPCSIDHWFDENDGRELDLGQERLCKNAVMMP